MSLTFAIIAIVAAFLAGGVFHKFAFRSVSDALTHLPASKRALAEAYIDRLKEK